MATSSPPPSQQSPTNASFPNSHAQRHSAAPSIISSRMTDIESEDGANLHAAGTASGLRPGTAASNNPYRPGSALSSHTRPSTAATTSRRGLGSPGSLNTLRAGRTLGAGSSAADVSRSGSATSKASRSHLPTLASQAFFHPMSSQRLQAQRSARPSRGKASVSTAAEPNTASSTRRNSLISNPTEFPSTTFRTDNEVPLPPTRGTEFTTPDDRATMNTSPDGKYTFQSYGGSERPLQHSRNGTLDSRMHRRVQESEDSPSLAKAPVPSVQKPGINYQYFSGNTIFFARGRLQNTRDRPINIASGLLIVIPSILFLVYSGPYLSDQASPAVPFFYAYLFFLCISSFIHASLTNPGILPRNLHLHAMAESEDPLVIPPPLTQWTMIKSAGVMNAAMDVPTKYCKTCNIWRPPRCHHCRVCDNCIETQDHHCVWINNCVGRRNYRYFFGFVTSGTLLGIYLIFGSLGHCLRYASSNHVSVSTSININRVPFAMFLYGILATGYPVCLWGYHLWLIARGETTREYLNSHKFLKKDRHRPFNQGKVIRNWIVMLVRPRTPTYLRFKAPYEDGDQRFGPKRAGKQRRRVAEKQGTGIEMENVAVVKHAPNSGHA